MLVRCRLPRFAPNATVPGVPDDLPPSATLADVGEDGLLAAIFPVLGQAPGALVGPGDVTAVVRAPDARVVVTTDLLVEGEEIDGREVVTETGLDANEASGQGQAGFQGKHDSR